MNNNATLLPDGSAFSVVSFRLPMRHWLYAGGLEEPPMGMRTGTDDPKRPELVAAVTAAVRYALRTATDRGRDSDFDPDALVQNAVVGLLGYYTPDGLSHADESATHEA